MLQLVEAGFGIAVLPRAVTQRLSHRMPLHILRASCTLTALPIHASYREDPGSGITESVLESAQAYVANTQTARKSARRAECTHPVHPHSGKPGWPGHAFRNIENSVVVIGFSMT